MSQACNFSKGLCLLVLCCYGLALTSARAFLPQSASGEGVNSFAEYFTEVAASQNPASSGREPAYEKLLASIERMKQSELIAGISIIDNQIDKAAQPDNLWATADALGLLRAIAFRPDGPELLASQSNRLSVMLNDPSHQLSALALSVFQMIGYKQPDSVWPILEAALDNPEVNNKSSIGPGIATILLFMGPHGDAVTEHVVQYMHRTDLTDSQLAETIEGINRSPVIPAILTIELVRSLDRPNDQVKTLALAGIARSTPAAREATRTRVQKMANDPNETSRIRQMAAKAL